MRVRDYMTPNPIVLHKEDPISRAASLLLENRIDGLPVVDEAHKLIGLVTKSHVFRAMKNHLPEETPVGILMQTRLVTLYDDQQIYEDWDEELDAGRLPVIDRSGTLVGILTRTDILRAFEHQTRKTISQLDAILQSTYHGIVAVDLTGHVLSINQAAERLLGISQKNMIRTSITELVSDKTLLNLLLSLEKQHMVRLDYGGRKLLINHTPIVTDEGKKIGMASVMQDITELEVISQELTAMQKLNRELDTIIESSHDGIVVTDRNGVIRHFNQAFSRMTGLPAYEAIGCKEEELERRGIISQAVSRLVIEKKKRVSVIQHAANGSVLLSTGTPILDDETGEILQIVMNCRDLSQLNRVKAELEEAKQLSERYHSELEVLRAQQMEIEGIIAESEEMRNILQMCIRIAPVDTSILILGESGVGKGVLAKLIHQRSDRGRGPFISINCGAIPSNLLESELFGYASGAFTGAQQKGKPGLIELADGGTLFLDEIGDLPLDLQVKLLTVLQEKHVTRIGDVKERAVDFRLIAATNANLLERVQTGTFREDLYYRINVVPIEVPPLRKRREDLFPMIRHFLNKFNEKHHTNKRISYESLEVMQAYSWPGNVRELENIIERLVVTTVDPIIEVKHLPKLMLGANLASVAFPMEEKREVGMHSKMVLHAADQESEKERLLALYEKYRSTRKVAKVLGVHQSTVVRRLNKYGVQQKK
ncbi:sigma 54-interacting transcriptional regulator [Aneurinibacillus thermoaerophilus]|uniref:sigma 54-interacting transcriptional regulator n=1 Tax=Aneurinibacillus thermoaerophilus TaxID=143495 RepID=UPI002E236D80|nr:sigma 54-interacting transcriptional regulator [Aneurinibacillus thermoaerophilus]MED0681331.1 sigma 54-interacting transcriptional regulator [Aneurinibacillus thermoaerophilus]MED0735459.1 sigma 54-interacting transcriptional regulator [Aneurinibacillus thermoaerophilus]MED0764260.1 sigma 54-interacting transcriptional regulator [Aneurinibacillus thermoaerophilus]